MISASDATQMTMMANQNETKRQIIEHGIESAVKTAAAQGLAVAEYYLVNPSLAVRNAVISQLESLGYSASYSAARDCFIITWPAT